MKKSIRAGILIISLFVCIVCFLSACSSQQERYYSIKDNYVTVVGTLKFINYSDTNDVLYLAFSNISSPFSDDCFKIVGDNLIIVQNNGFDEKIEIGDTIEFVSAPKYFGDGYVMPIVALSANGEDFLIFDEGYCNLMEWLDD